LKRNNTAKQNTHRGGDGQRAANRPIDKTLTHLTEVLGKKIGSFGYSVKKKKK